MITLCYAAKLKKSTGQIRSKKDFDVSRSNGNNCQNLENLEYKELIKP